MALNTIEKLLQQTMGLHSATVGATTISQAVNMRMRDCGVERINDYLAIVKQSATELNALIDAVIIPETWFFRDRNPFNAFSKWINDNQKSFTPRTPAQILSLPCSSGEEPYTLAMCLTECGVKEDHARIDAIDISERNLARARTAEYGSNSFRGADLQYRNHYFKPSGERYRLNDDIVTRVNFERSNLLDEDFLLRRPRYHVIFCRNLLIYFDRATQQFAIDRLSELLDPNGLLFLGHSETSLLKGRPFVALEHPRSFGFRRGTREAIDDDISVTPVRSLPKARKRPAQPARISAAKPAHRPSLPPEPEHKEASTPQTSLMQRAFQLADEGHLDEAAELCETLLRQQDYQVDAHYLLGVIREAAGNSMEAEQLFRRTVYLDPGHTQALTHLSVIASRCGDEQNARRYRERAARAHAGKEKRRAER